MQRRTWSAILLGGTIGAIFGLALVALAAGRVIGSGVESLPVLNEPVRATFLVQQSALYILVTVGGAVGGAAIALVGYAVGRLSDPDDPRISATVIAIVGAVSGAILAFVVSRMAIAVGGTITEGVVSLSVFRAAMVGLISGGATGAVISGSVQRLGRPEVIGFEGAARPSNPAQFARDVVAAIGLPVLGLIVAGVVVFGFSQVLLSADHVMALVAFGGLAALVLMGAAAIAALPPRRGEPNDD